MMQCPKCKTKVKKDAMSCRCGAKLRKMLTRVGKSSIGMDENVAAASAYAFIFLSGIFFLLVERKSRFVRFHALQSAVAFFIVFVVNIALAFVPHYGIFLAVILWTLNLLLLINLFIKAMAGEWYMLPVVGPLAESWSGSKDGCR